MTRGVAQHRRTNPQPGENERRLSVRLPMSALLLLDSVCRETEESRSAVLAAAVVSANVDKLIAPALLEGLYALAERTDRSLTDVLCDALDVGLGELVKSEGS